MALINQKGEEEADDQVRCLHLHDIKMASVKLQAFYTLGSLLIGLEDKLPLIQQQNCTKISQWCKRIEFCHVFAYKRGRIKRTLVWGQSCFFLLKTCIECSVRNVQNNKRYMFMAQTTPMKKSMLG